MDNQVAPIEVESKKATRTKLNFVFNVVYQMLVVLTPLIVAPYIARVLGTDNIGKFSYVYAIISYFVVVANLGFSQYAQRTIAASKGNKEEQSRVFWQIVILRLIPVSASLLILWILYITGFFGGYSSLVLIFAILVLACAFDINFYFHGKENFLLVMVINLIIRVGFLAAVFLLIKSKNDLKVYILLYVLMIIGGYLSMWVLLPRSLQLVKLHGLNFKQHMKSATSLFIPVAAVVIYSLLDRTLIGLLIHGQQYLLDSTGSYTILALISEVENGYYYQAERITRAILSVLIAFGTVMTTRNTIEYSNKHIGAVKKNIYRSFRFVFAFGVPMLLGVVVIANSFVPLYFGKQYFYDPRFACDGVANLLMLYSPVILFSGCNNILGSQFLLPTKHDKEYTISVSAGFAINLLLNLLLIPKMGAAGAVVGTLVSEFSITFIQYIYARKYFSLRLIFLSVYKYLIAGTIMCVAGYTFWYYALPYFDTSNLVNMFILIPGCIAIYYLVLLILKDHYVFRFTKFVLVTIGHFFKGTFNRTTAYWVSRVLTASPTGNYSELTKHQAPVPLNEQKNHEQSTNDEN